MTDINKVISDLGATFEAHQKAVDERLKLVEKGASTAEIDAKLDKIGKDLVSLEEIKQRLDRVEADADKPAGGKAAELREKGIEAFKAFVKNPNSLEAREAMLAVSSPEYLKAVSVGSPSGGGYALPEQIDSMIESTLKEISPVWGLVRKAFPTTTDYKKLVNVRGTASGWVAETTSRSETATSELREVTPTYGGLYAEPRATNWSIQDLLLDVAGWIRDEVATEFDYQLNQALIDGNGSNKPTGFLAGAPVAISDSLTESPLRPFGTLEYIASGVAGALPNDLLGSPQGDPAALFHDVVKALKAGYRGNARWLMNRRTLATIAKFRDVDGRNLWQPSLIAGVPSTLVGYPVVEVEGMPEIGSNTFPIAFGDFNHGYLATSYRGSWAITDPYTTKGYTKFYTEKRYGGKVLKDEAIKLVKCAAS